MSSDIKHGSIAHRVLAQLPVGVVTTRADIADKAGMDVQQVSNGISHLRMKGYAVDMVGRAKYVYRGGGSQNGKSAIVPHKAKAQVIALAGEDRLLINVEGVVYVAKPLDLDF